MNRQEIEVLLSQHSPDESRREAQLAEVVRELIKKVEKQKQVLIAVNKFGASHFEECYYLNEEGDEDVCDCGGYKVQVMVADCIIENEI